MITLASSFGKKALVLTDMRLIRLPESISISTFSVVLMSHIVDSWTLLVQTILSTNNVLYVTTSDGEWYPPWEAMQCGDGEHIETPVPRIRKIEVPHTPCLPQQVQTYAYGFDIMTGYEFKTHTHTPRDHGA